MTFLEKTQFPKNWSLRHRIATPNESLTIPSHSINHSNMCSSDHDTQIILIPKWGGTPKDDWYPWVKEEIEKKFPNVFVNILDMPDPELPTIPKWVPVAEAALKKAKNESYKKIYVAGHSVGCQTAIRAVDNLKSADDKFTVDGVFLVAAWFYPDEPWPTGLQWIETPVNTQNVTKSTLNFHVVVSDNDPYTSVARDRKVWEERIPHCQVHVIPGASHFTTTKEPAVLAELEKLLS